MKRKHYLTIIFILVMKSNILGQAPAITLNPGNISPSFINLATSNAGSTLANPFVDYTTQTIVYSWPNAIAYIFVYSSTIPTGFTYTVEASAPISGTVWKNGGWGYSTGQLTVYPNQGLIIADIDRCENVVCPLTQNLTITDFSKLHSGTYLMSINFIVRNNY